MANNKRLLIDGKTVRSFLLVRESYLDSRPCYYQVEAFDKDHAVARLMQKYPFVEKRDIEVMDELDAEHDIGMIGEKIPLIPAGAIIAPFLSFKRH